MARYSAGVLTGAGSTSLPIISLYAAAAVGGRVREIGVFNTTTVAVALNVQRLTSSGTPGAGLTEGKYDVDSAAASCTARATHSVAPTLGDDMGYRASLGAQVGAGVIWTFGEEGIRTDVGIANGVGVVVENGTGQACQAYLVWDE